MFLLITVYCVYIMNAVAFNTDHHGLHIYQTRNSKYIIVPG